MNRYFVNDLFWKLKPRKVVTLPSEHPNGPRALFSYLPRPVGWKDCDQRFHGHSNLWESREIAHQLMKMDYNIDSIFCNDLKFLPRTEYEVLFDIHKNLSRLASFAPDAIKLLHMTGSYPSFQNKAEINRAEEFEARTGMKYKAKRQVPEGEEYDNTMRLADQCSLIGNEQTLLTYPEEIRDKIHPVTVSASTGYVKDANHLLSNRREFVWFFGTGAVHKGLDLVLEAFIAMPDLTLNVIGNVAWEKDFMAAYGDLLLKGLNIKYHGYLNPEGTQFKEIADRCCAFIAPSCSEGISPAVATVMRTGLYPIVSRETGITLLDDHGTYLEHCHIDEIIQACQDVAHRSDIQLIHDIQASQAFALRKYSREAFTADMHSYLATVLEQPSIEEATQTQEYITGYLDGEQSIQALSSS